MTQLGGALNVAPAQTVLQPASSVALIDPLMNPLRQQARHDVAEFVTPGPQLATPQVCPGGAAIARAVAKTMTAKKDAFVRYELFIVRPFKCGVIT
jgi:hypothetical protein